MNMKTRTYPKRIYQSAYCCGHRYSRYTWENSSGGAFYANGRGNGPAGAYDRSCSKCGRHLQYQPRPKNWNPTRDAALLVIQALPEPFTLRHITDAVAQQHPGITCNDKAARHLIHRLIKHGAVKIVEWFATARATTYARTPSFSITCLNAPAPAGQSGSESDPSDSADGQSDSDLGTPSETELAWRAFRATMQIPGEDAPADPILKSEI